MIIPSHVQYGHSNRFSESNQLGYCDKFHEMHSQRTHHRWTKAINKCLRTLPSKDTECLTYNGAQDVTLDGTLVRNQTELPERIESSWH